VVTSKFHMGRTRAAFEWVWGLNPAPPGPDGAHIVMDFAETPDDGLTEETLAARAGREAGPYISTLTFHRNSGRFVPGSSTRNLRLKALMLSPINTSTSLMVGHMLTLWAISHA
jgi:hypothetical protein